MRKIYLFIFCSIWIACTVSAQVTLNQRKSWNGPFDIKMAANQNLEPVYINYNSTQPNLLKVDSVIPYSTIAMSGNLLNTNNDYYYWPPIQKKIPLPSILCSDPNAPCLNGFPLDNPSSLCPVRYMGSASTVNKYVAMTYADYDTDMSTYSSSMAQLDIPPGSTIESAYLYWAGNLRKTKPSITLATPTASYNGVGNVFDVSAASGYTQVKLKLPEVSTYQPVSASSTYIDSDGISYVCVSDVTSIIQGTEGGKFWVANIQTYPAESQGGSYSGWVLVVVFNPQTPGVVRAISLLDGRLNVPQGTSEIVTLSGIKIPASTSINSYMGYAALDGENHANEFYHGGDAPEGLGFQTNAGGVYVEINPFETDQPHYKMWDDKGYPIKLDFERNMDECKTPLFDVNWATVYNGISSSRITTYDENTGKNGNEMIRLPNHKNTLGIDAHHMKIPSSALTPGATQAYLTIKGGDQGSITPFLAYLVIENDNIMGAPKASAGRDQIICGGASSTLKGVVSGVATGGIWTTSGSGTFSANTLNASYIPSAADVSSGSVTLTLTTTGSVGFSEVSDEMVIIYTSPSANAGADQSICSGTKASLSGSITGTTALWTSSGGGQFLPNANSLNASYLPSYADNTNGSVTLTLTSSGGTCATITDQMVITYNKETANAGLDQSLCSGSSAVLSGTITGVTATWISNGSGTFSPNANSLNVTYIPSVADTLRNSVSFKLTSSDGACAANYDQVLITYIKPKANAGLDNYVCSGSTAYLQGTVTGTTALWTSSGTGQFSPDANSLSTSYILSSEDTENGTATLTLTSSGGPCPIVSDQIIINYIKANAGADQTICSTTAAALNGTISGTTATWTSSGSGTFSPDANSLNATYTPSSADILNGSVTLTLTPSGGACTLVSDQMMLTIEVCTGVKHSLFEDLIKVYPNPSSGIINVEIPEMKENSEMKIFSIIGVLQRNILLTNDKQQIDLNGIQQGMYLYEIHHSGERIGGGMLQVK